MEKILQKSMLKGSAVFLLLATQYIHPASTRTHLLSGGKNENCTAAKNATDVPATQEVYHFKQARYEVLIGYHWTNKEGQKVIGGPSFDLFDVFQKKTGITLEYVEPIRKTFGNKINGSYDGEKGLLQRKIVDLSSNPIIFNHDILSFAEYTIPYFSSIWDLIVRRAPPIGFAEILMLPFQSKVWTCFIVSIIVGTLVWHFMRSVTSSKTTERESTVLYMIELIFSGSCSSQPATLPLRLILGTLLCFFLVMNNAYQGQLLGFLSAPPSPYQMQTLAEAVPTLKRIYSYTSLKNMLKLEDDDNDTLSDMEKKIELIAFNEIVKALTAVSGTNEEGVLLPHFIFEFITKMKNTNDIDEQMFHVIPEDVFPQGYMAYIVRKDSPLQSIFSDYALRIMEAGLFDFWTFDQIHLMVCNGVRMPDHQYLNYQKEASPLTMEQLAGAFIALAVGVALGACACLVELSRKRCRRRQRCQQPLDLLPPAAAIKK